MRVLMVSDVYFPRVNGVSTSIQTYRSDLQSLGCATRLVVPRYTSPWRDDGLTLRVASVRVPLDPEDRMMRPCAVRRALREAGRRADVIHIQTPFLAHWAGVNLSKAFGMPVVETYHTLFEEYLRHYVPFLPSRLLRGLARRFSRRQCNEVDAVVSPSRAMADALTGYGVSRPIHVIPTGLQLSQFETGDGGGFRRRHGISQDRPVLLHVGRVAAEKNIDFIFDVLAQIRAEISNVLLVVAGEGPALPHFRGRAFRENLSANVLFVGYLGRESELMDCYASADAFVFASATETQGLVLLEAMAAGLPVVSTAVFGTREILENAGGVRVAEQNVEAFASVVMEMLRDPALRRLLSVRARADAARWSSERMAKRMLELYERLVSQERS